MEKDPVADECKEEFEKYLDELPFDDAIIAVRGLRDYLKEAQRELFQVEGRQRYVMDIPDTNDLPD